MNNTRQIQAIDNVINKEISLNHISGANIMISKGGQILFQGSYGLADIENNIPMKEDTIFRMFSMSKMITSVCAMILMERGRIDLFDPVSKYLPGFKNQKVWTRKGQEVEDVHREMILKDLLNMTSGLTYPEENNYPTSCSTALFNEMDSEHSKGKRIGTVEFANRIGELPLEFQPGKRWRYGTSADVMGAVVEVASGKRFGQFIEDEITRPLHMHDTGFYVPEEKIGRLAQKYRFFADGELAQPTSVIDSVSGKVKIKDVTGKLVIEKGPHLAMEDTITKAPAFESGGAGIVSTIGDFRNFGQMLLNGGTASDGTRILGKETVRFMRTNQLTPEQIKTTEWDSLQGYGYGNFNRVLLDPAAYQTNAPVGEFGWDGWLGTYMTLDPSNDFMFQYFIQLADAGSMGPTRLLRQIAYGMI
ncbi:CubicO group peptidase, beta-lactamase class C family [Butyrivibrio fibrisolvens DSM 3071]|uniref:CubicO group peptidase, beta-lactamase class C family n=1 Tax=Butyrivibrio fibrisolvens DSM 3071 TaxID=1121131 RepID=A0A1M5ZP45_BUTFI|nr:serine hydrolase domain-containing protein [Butyrivibrio fibrisolvens]SHI26057.1 CubicO group peptidase, beta-lactamase class C family [Butyrivibrio fibrisolvens DSM 3071]